MIKEVGFRRNRWNEIFNSYGERRLLNREWMGKFTLRNLKMQNILTNL